MNFSIQKLLCLFAGAIIFGSDQEVREVMRAVRRNNATGAFSWIGSDGWSARNLVSDGNEPEVNAIHDFLMRRDASILEARAIFMELRRECTHPHIYNIIRGCLAVPNSAMSQSAVELMLETSFSLICFVCAQNVKPPDRLQMNVNACK